MAEYRIHCKHCGYEGQANSRWIPFVQVEKRGQDCPHCGRPTPVSYTHLTLPTMFEV